MRIQYVSCTAIVVVAYAMRTPPPSTEVWLDSKYGNHLQVELVAPAIVEERPVDAGHDDRTVRAHEQQAPLQLPPPLKALSITFSVRGDVCAGRIITIGFFKSRRYFRNYRELTLICRERNRRFAT